VVGIGLNVNLDPGQLPQDLLMAATSLSQALGRKVPRLPLLRNLLRAIEVRYRALQAGQLPQAEWAARLVTLGQAVAVSTMNSCVEGVAEGVDDDGALLLRLPDGRLETVLVGDVTLRTREARAWSADA
jgi:BirA family biotin operon repressor/biotin-[acetyl-CoA-carboxylase] ligase